MSRTAHHKPWKHWNIKRTSVSCYPSGTPYRGQLRVEEETAGDAMSDLRFYAGCKRIPQHVSIVRWYYGYYVTWGHYGGAAEAIARKYRSRARAREREYGLEVSKVYRAGGDIDEILKPESRTRHQALWDAW